jgi:hypothetical protein
VTKTETNEAHAPQNGVPAPAAAANNVLLQRSLLIAGIASASAALTFFLVRNAMRRAPVDETTERIQLLIDEANRLLKQLDEKKHG